jgi:prepilin-type processing-associated H-X9-DG protein
VDAALTFRDDLDGIDWRKLKRVLARDNFDNGRTPRQYQLSFENSYATCLVFLGDRLIGVARLLSDGVCNAYLVDVWTHSAFRRRGIARAMIERLLRRCGGQHIYLFTDGHVEFYHRLGFKQRGTGLQRIVGTWLENDAR